MSHLAEKPIKSGWFNSSRYTHSWKFCNTIKNLYLKINICEFQLIIIIINAANYY